jgi:hypothetical protein
MKNKIVHYSIIGIFVSLYFLVATISMINSVEFFDISHNRTMSWVLALGFELGAAASLAAILILERTSKIMVWGLFILLTSFQMMANSYHAYINLENYIPWIELFGLTEEDPLTQKRILSIISGAILPIVALGFIKSLTDYIKPKDESVENINEPETKQVEEENLFDTLDQEDEPSLSDLDRFYEYDLGSLSLQNNTSNKEFENDVELEEASLTDLEKFYEEEENFKIEENEISNDVKVKNDLSQEELPSANAKDGSVKQQVRKPKNDSMPLKRQIRMNTPGTTEFYKP